MFANMFARSFTSTSLGGVWRFWNPGYGYILLMFCYQPLRQYFSHSISVVVAFLVCGLFFHDVFYMIPLLFRDGQLVFPFVTVWFAAIGLGVVIADHVGIEFSWMPKMMRIPIHLGFLVLTFLFTRFVDIAIATAKHG